MNRVPENVLRAKYSQILSALMQPLVKYGENANNVTLIKSVKLFIFIKFLGSSLLQFFFEFKGSYVLMLAPKKPR